MVARTFFALRNSPILSLKSMSSQIVKSEEADAENAEKLAGDVAVERPAEAVDQAGQRRQETQCRKHHWPGLVGPDIGVRETDELAGDGAVFPWQQQGANHGTQRGEREDEQKASGVAAEGIHEGRLAGRLAMAGRGCRVRCGDG
jgi:hypothetical protein